MRFEIRALLCLCGAALMALLTPLWVIVDPFGWTAYAPLNGEEPDDAPLLAIGRELARFEERGWSVLGAGAVVVVVLAAALIAVSALGRPVPAGLAVALSIAAIVSAALVVVVGFDPEPVSLHPDFIGPGGEELPDRLDRESTWAPVATLVALAATVVVVALAFRDRRRDVAPGSATLAVGGVVLAGSLAFPWTVDLHAALIDTGESGLGFLGWKTVPLALAALLAAAVAWRPARVTAALALSLLVLAAVVVLARGFRGAVPAGPDAALIGCWLGALGALALLLPERVAGLRAVALAAALALLVMAFLPRGAFTGTQSESAALGDDVVSAAWLDGERVGSPALWIVPGVLLLAAVLRRPRR